MSAPSPIALRRFKAGVSLDALSAALTERGITPNSTATLSRAERGLGPKMKAAWFRAVRAVIDDLKDD